MRGDGGDGEDARAHAITVAGAVQAAGRAAGVSTWNGREPMRSVSTWKREVGGVSRRTPAGWCATAGSAGSSSTNVVAPGRLETVTVPPIRPASSRAIASPSPLPDAWPPSTR